MELELHRLVLMHRWLAHAPWPELRVRLGSADRSADWEFSSLPSLAVGGEAKGAKANAKENV